jgi:outer membrane scaffolding protein for murein synthesis (MipA/OmpV family)
MFLLLVTGTAHAGKTSPWEIGIGIGGVYGPDYRGADEEQGYLLPFPYLLYHGERVTIDQEGARGRLFSSPRLTLYVSGGAGLPADSQKNAARAGMADLLPTWEIGPALDVQLWRDAGGRHALSLRLPLRAVIATDLADVRDAGILFAPHLDYRGAGLMRSEWKPTLSVGPLFASERYHEYFYEVESASATASRPAYEARGGYSGSRTTVMLSRDYGRVWAGAFVRYDWLDGAVFEDSPLVRRERSVIAGVAVTYALITGRR